MAALSTSVEEVRTAQLQSKRSRRRYKELVSRHLHAAPAKLEALIGGICRYVGPRPDGIQRHISNFTVQILNPTAQGFKSFCTEEVLENWSQNESKSVTNQASAQ